jgi:hypothetical protein
MSSISPPNPGHPVEDDTNSPDEPPLLPIDWTTPPLIQSGQEAYQRDLLELLEKHKGRWVAYSGDRRLGIIRTRSQAYELGFKDGLAKHEFIVLGIDPSDLDDIYWEDFSDI